MIDFGYIFEVFRRASIVVLCVFLLLALSYVTARLVATAIYRSKKQVESESKTNRSKNHER